jgi:hypothetical protein
MEYRRPTFESVRTATSNGKFRTRVLIYGTSVECRAKAVRARAEIDFDLHSCNYDLRSDVADQLRGIYDEYRKTTRFKTKLHPHFNRSSIWFDVHREHAEEWFDRVFSALEKPESITLCDAALEFAEYMQTEADVLLLGSLIEFADVTDRGSLVSMVLPAWHQVLQLVRANPKILEAVQ